MTQRPRSHKKQRGPGRALLRLHRRVGVALSAIFIVICITGILLNHSDDLDFQSTTVDSDWVYDWYGLKPAGDPIHFSLASQSIASLDGQLYLDKQTLGHFPAPVGVAELTDFKAIAFETSILLITNQGEIIETLPSPSIPGNSISRITTIDKRTLIIDTESSAYISDESILDWKLTIWNESLTPIPSTPISKELNTELLRSFRSEGITWGRVLLDIHTGRFFGTAGKWIADLSGIALILLTLTGVYYTMRYLKKARERTDSR